MLTPQFPYPRVQQAKPKKFPTYPKQIGGHSFPASLPRRVMQISFPQRIAERPLTETVSSISLSRERALAKRIPGNYPPMINHFRVNVASPLEIRSKRESRDPRGSCNPPSNPTGHRERAEGEEGEVVGVRRAHSKSRSAVVHGAFG